MRTLVSLVLFAPLSLVACSDTKDPLDGLTAVPDTSGGDTTSGGGTDGPTSSDGGSASMSASGNPATSATSTGDPPDPTGSSATTSASSPGGDPTSATSTTADPGDPYGQARQLCVDTINMYRATIGLPPYQRWSDAETCSDDEAAADAQSGTPHGAFGQCGEFAQNECPGWPSPAEQSLPDCLAQMWAEGPGEDFQMHGHYINMSSTDYTMVACGFADIGGELWMVQNFK
ncbi:CAP domain-containing protein [Nannocystis pusilla]|uniref:CAP domain-containing protein n=1 Tax=Nannocystis pusilla TaxID=889268 RepID=A0ABS7TZJ5_9BACT|nr:CAP domain-containing protein [Nannocystis pusilla]MBZ5713601.1 CAP domain-containing protein [Nannocystis pusilla]